MITSALIYIVETVVNLFVLAVLTRFWAQVFRASFRNPIAVFVVALTDWVIKPTRRLLPSTLGLDTASIFVAWLVEAMLLLVVLMMQGLFAWEHPLFWTVLGGWALLEVFKLSLWLLFGALILQAVLSWLNPYHPIQPFFDSLTRVFLRPLRRMIPLVGGVDLSPLVLLLIIQVMMMPLVALRGSIQQSILALMR